MGASEETIALLKSIDASLKQLVAASKTAAAAPVTVAGAASEAELDGKFGDPEIKRDPKRWLGASMVGKRYSETTPDYLQCVADFKAWQAQKDDEAKAVDDKGRPKSHWAHKDRALALGWAARLRSGWKPAAPAAFDDNEPIDFQAATKRQPPRDTDDPFANDGRFDDAF